LDHSEIRGEEIKEGEGFAAKKRCGEAFGVREREEPLRVQRTENSSRNGRGGDDP